MSAYTYFPLASTRHTRILQLDAAQDPSEDLKCRLVQINIDTDDASYEAVSYAWGQPDFCCHILVGGKEKLRITRSLKDALCRFRLASEVRRLWVDAICINQSDDFEKSTHIPLMSTIYQGALRVLAWLGDNQDDVKAMIKVSKLARRARVTTRPLGLQLSVIVQTVDRLLSIPWFSRRWIVQEVVQNPDVILACGKEDISWQTLAAVVRLSRQISSDRSTTALDAFMTMFNLWVHSNIDTARSDDCNLLNLLDSFRHFDCSDDRDFLYSLASLAPDVVTSTDTSGGTKSRASKFAIDVHYGWSTEEVYARFAQAAISSGHLIWVLRNAVIKRQTGSELKLPSWVPDLRALLWNHFRYRPFQSLMPRYVTRLENGALFVRQIDVVGYKTKGSGNHLDNDPIPFAVEFVSSPIDEPEDVSKLLYDLRQAFGTIQAKIKAANDLTAMEPEIKLFEGAEHEFAKIILDPGRFQYSRHSAFDDIASLYSSSFQSNDQKLGLNKIIETVVRKFVFGEWPAELNAEPLVDFIKQSVVGRRFFTCCSREDKESGYTKSIVLFGLGPRHLMESDNIITFGTLQPNHATKESKTAQDRRARFGIRKFDGNVRETFDSRSRYALELPSEAFQIIGECFLSQGSHRYQAQSRKRDTNPIQRVQEYVDMILY